MEPFKKTLKSRQGASQQDSDSSSSSSSSSDSEVDIANIPSLAGLQLKANSIKVGQQPLQFQKCVLPAGAISHRSSDKAGQPEMKQELQATIAGNIFKKQLTQKSKSDKKQEQEDDSSSRSKSSSDSGQKLSMLPLANMNSSPPQQTTNNDKQPLTAAEKRQKFKKLNTLSIRLHKLVHEQSTFGIRRKKPIEKKEKPTSPAHVLQRKKSCSSAVWTPQVRGSKTSSDLGGFGELVTNLNPIADVTEKKSSSSYKETQQDGSSEKLPRLDSQSKDGEDTKQGLPEEQEPQTIKEERKVVTFEEKKAIDQNDEESSLDAASSSGKEEVDEKTESSVCLSEGDPDRVSSIAAQSMKSQSLWGQSNLGSRINPSFNFKMLSRSIAMHPIIDSEEEGSSVESSSESDHKSEESDHVASRHTNSTMRRKMNKWLNVIKVKSMGAPNLAPLQAQKLLRPPVLDKNLTTPEVPEKISEKSDEQSKKKLRLKAAGFSEQRHFPIQMLQSDTENEAEDSIMDQSETPKIQGSICSSKQSFGNFVKSQTTLVQNEMGAPLIKILLIGSSNNLMSDIEEKLRKNHELDADLDHLDEETKASSFNPLSINNLYQLNYELTKTPSCYDALYLFERQVKMLKDHRFDKPESNQQKETNWSQSSELAQLVRAQQYDIIMVEEHNLKKQGGMTPKELISSFHNSFKPFKKLYEPILCQLQLEGQAALPFEKKADYPTNRLKWPLQEDKLLEIMQQGVQIKQMAS